jgi:hypothetical protein
MRIADLSATRVKVGKTSWQATVTIRVTTPRGTDVAGATITGDWSVGASDTCTTTAAGTCSVQSDVLSRSATRAVTFDVSDASHATHDYDPVSNLETSITVSRP